MNKFLAIIGICIIPIFGIAQKPFEGELHYRSMENHDNNIIKFSSDMAYNGARNTSYTIKGNKTLFKDDCTQMSLLLDPENNNVTLYSDLIKKGMQFDYKSYAAAYLGSFTKEGPSFMGHGMPPTLYRFEPTGENIDFMNYSTEYLKGRIENKTASTSFDLYRTLSFNMPKTMYAAQMYGIELDGLIVKITWEQVNNVPTLGEFKSYVYTELKEIVERPVDDSELAIPKDIKIDKSESPFKVVSLYKDNAKYLEEHNMYPTQVNKDVIYKIDETWDF